MVTATLLALVAAVLHAGWNLIAKRAIDPFVALWGQFAVAGLLSAVVVVVLGGVPIGAWGWATLTGLIHVPYVVGLAAAYRRGDFSLAYPVARGGGALVAAIGGVALLGDDLGVVSMIAVGVVTLGLFMLSFGAPAAQFAIAAGVAVSIGCYTVVDSHAARNYDGVAYVFAVFVMIGLCVSVVGVATGRTQELLSIGASAWRRTTLAAVMSTVTYGLVLLAVRRAPVGYVAALRESSVLIASLIGWRLLGEGRGHIRLAASAVIVSGLVLLVVSS